MSRYQRRLFDKDQESLEDMIAEEDDASRRTLLLILNNLNSTLKSNTVMTEDVNNKLTLHLDRFGQHLEKYNEYVNKGKGIWIILMWAFAVVQAILGVVAMNVAGQLKEHSAIISTLQQDQVRLVTVLTALKESK